MAGNIKGITIEFKGETRELDEAIRRIRSSTKDVDKELKAVDNALKFNPTNVDLWRQKQELLRQKITQTKTNLSELKNAQKQLDADGVDKNSEEYRALQREIITTESKLKHFEGELRKVGNVKLKALSEQLKQVGSKMTAVGKTMTKRVTAPIVAGYTAAAKYASDYEENLNKLDVAFGENSKSVKDWANNARTAYGLSKVQATEAASAFGALGKGIGLSQKASADMSTTLAGLSSDLGSYFNVGVDESAKALEGIFTGESEALKKFGVVMTDTNLKQFAADQGLVWSEMSQTEKTMLRYQFVLDKTKDAQGDFARTSDGTANSTKIFQASIQDLGTSIGTVLLPIITPIIQKITELVNKFNELSPTAQRIITIVGLVVAAIGPVLVIIGTLISSIGTIAGALGMVSAPMLGIVGIIAAVIAAGVALYKNWDKIKAFAASLAASLKAIWSGIKSSVTGFVKGIVADVVGKFRTLVNNVKTSWNNIKNAIIRPIREAVGLVRTAINKIKSIINGAKLRLPHFKLPHFRINGGKLPWGIGGKGTPPSINVDWYKRAMNDPYMFSSPTFFGAGEAGDEMLYGRAALMRDIADAVSRGGGANGPSIVININGADKDPRQIAEEVRRILIKEVNGRRLAWQ